MRSPKAYKAVVKMEVSLVGTSNTDIEFAATSMTKGIAKYLAAMFQPTSPPLISSVEITPLYDDAS